MPKYIYILIKMILAREREGERDRKREIGNRRRGQRKEKKS